MRDLTVDTSELSATATNLHVVAATAVTEVITTTLGVASHNKAWGTDDIGGAFAHVYLGPAEETLEAVQQIAFHIGEIAERLGDSAVRYDGTEDDNVVAVSATAAEAGNVPPPTGTTAPGVSSPSTDPGVSA